MRVLGREADRVDLLLLGEGLVSQGLALGAVDDADASIGGTHGEDGVLKMG